jgi:opacity protein-like surface antigen
MTTLLFALPAAAQVEHPVEFKIGGGVIWPMSNLKNDFNAGGTFEIGGTFWFHPNIGIEADYNYQHMNGPEKVIGLSATPVAATGTGLIESNHHIHSGTFDLVYRSHNEDSMVHGYGLAGLGIYHRVVQLTTPSVGYTTVCDPYWYICYPGYVSIDQIVGERSSNDFGINIGAGVTFGHAAKVYVEGRYTYVWGPTVNPPAGLTAPSGEPTSNVQYIQLTFGLKL